MSRTRQSGNRQGVRAPRLTVEQEPFLTVRSYCGGYPARHLIENHSHEWHQLLYTGSGAMTLYTQRTAWLVAPGRAVFIPAGIEHSIRIWGSAMMQSLYLRPDLPGASANCRVIPVAGFLRELILQVIAHGALDERMLRHQHLLALLLDEIARAETEPLMLPIPVESRASALAKHVLSDPAGASTLDELAKRFAASRRTVERVFQNETGLSFGLWRQKVRMLAGVRVLAEGRSVTDAAIEAGYSSVSAFVAAFRQTFGTTPGKLLKR